MKRMQTLGIFLVLVLASSAKAELGGLPSAVSAAAHSISPQVVRAMQQQAAQAQAEDQRKLFSIVSACSAGLSSSGSSAAGVPAIPAFAPAIPYAK